MPAVPVQANELLVRGLRTEFVQTYEREIKRVEPYLSRVMDLNLPSNKLSEIYGYLESAPHWKRWQRGDEIPQDSFRGRTFTVINYDWGIRVPWHDNDEQDDQSQSLVARVRNAATGVGILAERVFFQILTGATDNDLLPAVPTAPDGANLFATTASSVNRFGVTNGNSLTSSGIGSTGLIQQDYFIGYTQFRKMLDTKGQPMHPAALLNMGLTAIYNVANEQMFRQAFSQMFVQGNAAAVSNPLLDAQTSGLGGAIPQLWPTPRITTNAWYMFLNGAPLKAIFQQVRQAPRDTYEDMMNSDYARATKIKALQWDARYGFGVSLPNQCLSLS